MKGDHMRNYYDILGITKKAPLQIVTAVYRAWMQALKVHPDLGGDEEMAKQLNAAYEILKDPARRAAYDVKLARDSGNSEGEARRRAPRMPVSAGIAFCIPPDGTWLAAQTVDASSLGLKVLTVKQLFEGNNVSVAFPGCAAEAVEAVVRWSRVLKGNGAWNFESGIEFFEPVPDILRRLGEGQA
jgi:hypothetical protein